MTDWMKYKVKYGLKCWLYMPLTFLKRVALGRDKLHKRFFWDKWGFLLNEAHGFRPGKVIWVVANSGGEVIQSRLFLTQIRFLYPDYKIILSTESYDTFQYAGKIEEVDFVFFTPWDMPFVCRNVVKTMHPKALIFIEHCYFPVLSRIAKELGILTFMFSAKINPHFLRGNHLLERSFGLKFYECFDLIGVKTSEDAENLFDAGMPRDKVSVLGDMRLDLSHLVLNSEDKIRLKEEINFEGNPIFLAGSVHKEETRVILEAFKIASEKYQGLKLVLAPRWKTDVLFMEGLIREFGYRYRRRSIPRGPSVPYDILILDTFGELTAFYGIATVAFIASSIIPINARKLGHNIFEPLAHGVPTLFGPNMNSWRKVADYLKGIWPGCEVNNAQNLADSTARLLGDDDLYRKLKAGAFNLTRVNCGIVESYLKAIKEQVG